jgi:hypothetical protein
VQTKPVYLRKPLKCTASENPAPPAQSYNVHKKLSLHLSSKLPASRLCYSSLAVAFPFSLINPALYTGFGSSFSCLMSQFSGL